MSAGRIRVVAPSWLQSLPVQLTVDGCPVWFNVPVTVQRSNAEVRLMIVVPMGDVPFALNVRCQVPVMENHETVVGRAF